MKVGDRVKIKINKEWREATIICLYAVPKNWDLADVQFNNGDIVRGISTKDLTIVE